MYDETLNELKEINEKLNRIATSLETMCNIFKNKFSQN